MSWYRLVKIRDVRYVQREDVEAETVEEAQTKWNDGTAEAVPQFRDGQIEAIAMVPYTVMD